MKKLIVIGLILFFIAVMAGCDVFNVDEISTDEKDTIAEELILVEKNPEEGFYWDYYLYIPETVSRDNDLERKNYMLVEPISTPERRDDIEYFENGARNTAKNNYNARKLGIPVLVPIFPWPKTINGEENHHLTHQLDRSTMKTNIEEYKRIDKQLIAMIDNARNILGRKNIHLEKEVFTYGFSSSGVFTNKFAALHPERVQAAAAGGISEPIIPEKEMAGEDLYYSVGLYDIAEITGSNINWEAYRETPQYIFRGADDGHDALLTLDGVEGVELSGMELYEKVMNTEFVGEEENNSEGAAIIKERLLKVEEIYENNNISIQIKFYEGAGHEITQEMREDVLEFFKNNAGY